MSDEISHDAHDHRPPLVQRCELDGARGIASDCDSHARPLLSLVVPFYNEAAVVDAFFAAVVPVLSSISHVDYEIVCVNDGSTDSTLDELLAACKANYRVRVIDLSRNFGKEAALTAGIDAAEGAAVIPFDADLQDSPEVIPQLVARWQEGYDVVLAKRAERCTDTLGKTLPVRRYLLYLEPPRNG